MDKLFNCIEESEGIENVDSKYNTFYMRRATLKRMILQIKKAFINRLLHKINEEYVLFNQKERLVIYNGVLDIFNIVSCDLQHVPDMWVGCGKYIGFEFTHDICRFYVGETSSGYPNNIIYLVEQNWRMC